MVLDEFRVKRAEILLQQSGDAGVLDAVRRLTALGDPAVKLAEVTQVLDTTMFAVRESVTPFITFRLPNGDLLGPRHAGRIKQAMLPQPRQGSQAVIEGPNPGPLDGLEAGFWAGLDTGPLTGLKSYRPSGLVFFCAQRSPTTGPIMSVKLLAVWKCPRGN